MELDHLEQDLSVEGYDLADREDKIEIFYLPFEIGLVDYEDDLVDEWDGEEELEDDGEDEDDGVGEDDLVDDGGLWIGLEEIQILTLTICLINQTIQTNNFCI